MNCTHQLHIHIYIYIKAMAVLWYCGCHEKFIEAQKNGKMFVWVGNMKCLGLEFGEWKWWLYFLWFLLPFGLYSGFSLFSVSEVSLCASTPMLPAWLLRRLRSWNVTGTISYQRNINFNHFTKCESWRGLSALHFN